MKTKAFYRIISVVLVLFVISSCAVNEEGGDNSDNGSPIGIPIKSSGLMTKGSVILNDITYTVAPGASIRIDDNPGSESELEDGMIIKLRGRKNDDGVTGEADAIEAEDEVQGTVTGLDTSANPPTFQVLSQTIYTDERTLFSNFPGPNPDDINDMSDGQFVEVHGLRDADGAIHATRIELKADVGVTPPEEDEVKGIVSGKSGTQFNIGLLLVEASGATFEPAGTTINDIIDGDLVEVEGNLSGLTFVATKVELEDLEDAEFEPDEGDDVEVEGFISGFTDHPGTFFIDGIEVQTADSTDFENGTPEDLIDNVEVEAEGYIIGGIFLVEKIEFKRARVKINAEATASSTSSVTLLGLTVNINDLTEIEAGLLPLPLATSVFYEVRGYQDSNGNLIAEEIKIGDNSRNILQALVISKNDAAQSITLLNTPLSTLIDLSDLSIEFKDYDENILADFSAFSALITTGKTVVKIRDDGPDGNWDKAEIEN